MEIKVSEVMDKPLMATESRVYVKDRKANPREAFNRMEHLIAILENVSRDINSVAVGDTEESWKDAYETLYVAVQRCVAEEKVIIMGA